jgi:class 3 adenylate cyclase
VGSDSGTTDITVLGDVANTAARLSSSAGVGEMLISDAAFQAAALDLGAVATRQLELKGKSQPVVVHVLPFHA